MSDIAVRQALEAPLPPPDSRGVCNRILDLARDQPVTNTVLQKLLYFAHGFHLVRTGQPLVYGYFEAWKSGPVHPSAFAAFAAAGDGPITFRALRRIPVSGGSAAISMPADTVIDSSIERIMAMYGSLPAGHLVNLSMAPGAPWAVTINKARTEIVLGMRISDKLICEKFGLHKMSVGQTAPGGVLPHDAPFA